MKKVLSLVLVICLVLSICVGCASPAPAKADTEKAETTEKAEATEEKADSGDDQIVIGFSQMGMENAWRIAETKSIKDEAEKRGFKLIYTDAQNDTAKQVSDVEDIIAKNPDLIMIAPREFEGITPALEAAKKAGIPVILIDRGAKGEAGVDYVTLIQGNIVWEGEQMAQYLVDTLGTDAEVKVVEVVGTPGSSAAMDRHTGFTNILDKYPNYEIIASPNGEFSQDVALGAMADVIQTHGDAINAVYAHDDSSALGAIQALKAAGMKPGEDIIVCGDGGYKSGAISIQEGEMNATIVCTPMFGPVSFDTIEKILAGETVGTFIENPGFVVDKNNVDEYMPDAF